MYVYLLCFYSLMSAPKYVQRHKCSKHTNVQESLVQADIDGLLS